VSSDGDRTLHAEDGLQKKDRFPPAGFAVSFRDGMDLARARRISSAAYWGDAIRTWLGPEDKYPKVA
jgi:hypothetical protein